LPSQLFMNDFDPLVSLMGVPEMTMCVLAF
jgi:hypothetical protein